MNKLLNYRNNCIICQKEMVLKYDGDHKLKITASENGLKITGAKSGIRYLFKPDGTYTIGKVWNSIYSKPIKIIKECPDCSSKVIVGRIDRLKKRGSGLSSLTKAIVSSLGIATIDNVKENYYSYSFVIDYGLGVYSTKLMSEDIRHCNAEEFWHLSSDFRRDEDQITSLYHGKFNGRLDSVLSLSLPAVNTASISSAEQFVEKFRLYTVFL